MIKRQGSPYVVQYYENRISVDRSKRSGKGLKVITLWDRRPYWSMFSNAERRRKSESKCFSSCSSSFKAGVCIDGM